METFWPLFLKTFSAPRPPLETHVRPQLRDALLTPLDSLCCTGNSQVPRLRLPAGPVSSDSLDRLHLGPHRSSLSLFNVLNAWSVGSVAVLVSFLNSSVSISSGQFQRVRESPQCGSYSPASLSADGLKFPCIEAECLCSCTSSQRLCPGVWLFMWRQFDPHRSCFYDFFSVGSRGMLLFGLIIPWAMAKPS